MVEAEILTFEITTEGLQWVIQIHNLQSLVLSGQINTVLKCRRINTCQLKAKQCIMSRMALEEMDIFSTRMGALWIQALHRIQTVLSSMVSELISDQWIGRPQTPAFPNPIARLRSITSLKDNSSSLKEKIKWDCSIWGPLKKDWLKNFLSPKNYLKSSTEETHLRIWKKCMRVSKWASQPSRRPQSDIEIDTRILMEVEAHLWKPLMLNRARSLSKMQVNMKDQELLRESHLICI